MSVSNSTVAGVGLGANLLGGVFSAFGAGKTAAAQKSQADYNAAVSRVRAQIDTQNAEYSRQEGELQAQRYGLQAGQRMGQIKAAQASSGLDVNSGSAAQVQASQRTITGIDLDTIRSNAAKTAYNYDVQSSFDTAQAGLYTMVGQDATAAGAINIGSTILGTAGSVSAKWLQGTQMGLFGGQSGSNQLLGT